MLYFIGAPGNGANSESNEEHWFGCPVCLMLLKPPTRIFQCPEGHILCEECKENPAMVHCPQCRYVIFTKCLLHVILMNCF